MSGFDFMEVRQKIEREVEQSFDAGIVRSAFEDHGQIQPCAYGGFAFVDGDIKIKVCEAATRLGFAEHAEKLAGKLGKSVDCYIDEFELSGAIDKPSKKFLSLIRASVRIQKVIYAISDYHQELGGGSVLGTGDVLALMDKSGVIHRDKIGGKK